MANSKHRPQSKGAAAPERPRPDDLLSPAAAGKLLDLTGETLRMATKQGRLPARRLLGGTAQGTRYIYVWADVEAWAKEREERLARRTAAAG